MKYLPILFLAVILFSCKKSVEKQKENTMRDSIIVYSEDDLYKIRNGMIKVVDTACINEEKRATEDIKNGKVVYFFFNGMTEMYRSNKEMKELLAHYNIQIDSAMTSCIPPLKGFRRNCYISVMYKEIEKRHGKNFIDSIRYLAERKYALNHPNIVFDFQECDTISRYPGTKNYSDFFDKPESDFSKTFEYPKGYNYKIEKYYSSTDVSFVLKKNGEIKNVETEVTFQNPKNLQFEDYFRKKAEEFVRNTKWIPATKKGIKVDSKVNFIYFHK